MKIGDTDEPGKRWSSRVLMMLVLIMFILHTIHKAVNWYQAWLAFIFHGDDVVQGAMIIEGFVITPTLNAVYTMQDLLTTLRLGIADGIMVSFSHTLSIGLSGLIDHLA
jgi:hypothetical protein